MEIGYNGSKDGWTTANESIEDENENETHSHYESMETYWSSTMDTLFLFRLLNTLTQDHVPLALICIGVVANVIAASITLRLVVLLRHHASNNSDSSSGVWRRDSRLDYAGQQLTLSCYYINCVCFLLAVEGYDWVQFKFRYALQQLPAWHAWCCKVWQYAHQVQGGLSSWLPLTVLWLAWRTSGRSKVVGRLRLDGYSVAKLLTSTLLITLTVLTVHSLWLYDAEDPLACEIFKGHHEFFRRVWPSIIHAAFKTTPTAASVVLLSLQATVRVRRSGIKGLACSSGVQHDMPHVARASVRLAWATLVHKTVFDLPCEMANAVAQLTPDNGDENSIIMTASVVFMRLGAMLCYASAPALCLLCDKLYRFELCALACSLCRFSFVTRRVAAHERFIISQLMSMSAETSTHMLEMLNSPSVNNNMNMTTSNSGWTVDQLVKLTNAEQHEQHDSASARHVRLIVVERTFDSAETIISDSKSSLAYGHSRIASSSPLLNDRQCTKTHA